VAQQASLLDTDASPTAPAGLRVAYESPRCTLYAGDCAELVGVLPTVDLLCTDPPYGMRFESGMNGGRFGPLLGDDGSLDAPGLLGGIVRAHLRQKRHTYVFGFHPEQLAEPLLLGGTAELIWDKVGIGMGDLTQPWAPQHEPIAFGCYRPSKTDRASGGGNLAARLRAGSILRYQRPNGTRVNRHPTEKPVPLMRELIESSTRLGELVLDPFAGSGSTLVAALLAGRRAIGCELDERYVQVAVQRIREAEQIADRIDAA
jgi:site-specific DNA-methyltransferase (adenine-specific)